MEFLYLSLGFWVYARDFQSGKRLIIMIGMVDKVIYEIAFSGKSICKQAFLNGKENFVEG